VLGEVPKVSRHKRNAFDQCAPWREVRKGAFGGSQRTWIRYSYHQSSAVVQVIGVVKGQASRDERELLETIMRSCHCES
jgi:hypothetical protein